MERRYSPEWWARMTDAARSISHDAEVMAESGNEMESLARERGWKEAEPGARFLCALFRVFDGMEGMRTEIRELMEEFPEFYDRMYEEEEEE